jgi:nitrogen-specific signal transduction histidine kinase
LGLAIVQSVVSDHHGTISVSSEEGHGTTFHIELPKRQGGTALKPKAQAKAAGKESERAATATD